MTKKDRLLESDPSGMVYDVIVKWMVRDMVHYRSLVRRSGSPGWI